MRSSFVVALFAALAGRALALTITFGTTNYTATQLITIADTDLNQACASDLSNAMSAISGCSDDNCLCNDATVAAIVNIENCWFNQLIKENRALPDPRAGSTPALGAYSAACLASVNVTLAPTEIALTLPDNWDGPFDSIFPMPIAVVIASIGGFLGISAILLLSNM